MLTAFGKRCSRPASLYDGLSRSDNIRPWDEPTHLIGADQKERACKYISSENNGKNFIHKNASAKGSLFRENTIVLVN